MTKNSSPLQKWHYFNRAWFGYSFHWMTLAFLGIMLLVIMADIGNYADILNDNYAHDNQDNYDAYADARLWSWEAPLVGAFLLWLGAHIILLMGEVCYLVSCFKRNLEPLSPEWPRWWVGVTYSGAMPLHLTDPPDPRPRKLMSYKLPEKYYECDYYLQDSSHCDYCAHHGDDHPDCDDDDCTFCNRDD